MKKVLLCIMDGVGLRDEKKGNAFLNAQKTTIDKILAEYPHISLNASGEAVGLPEGQMGNSEVGHQTIGTGRVIYQSLAKINKEIANGQFYQNRELLAAINHAKKNNSKLHLIGLLSDGGIHSNINHLFALLELCKKEHFTNVYLHPIMDGRDTSPTSGINYLLQLEDKIREIGLGKIATLCGRYYTMDRDNNYDRISLAYNLMVNGLGDKYDNPINAWKTNQDKNITDEFIKPSLIDAQGLIEDNDTLITFNYRPDRLREIFAALTNQEFSTFERKILTNLKLVTMMPVAKEVICTNAYGLEIINNTLGEVIADNGLSQLRIAETEKYAHVTYFFDGGKELTLPNCTRELIPSPKVATYDLQPEMSAEKITDKLLEELNKHPDLIILNYANGDMVGHTGVYEKAVIAVETIDKCLSKILSTISLTEYTIIITADHGNCEQMINDDGTVNTQHTTNLVPFIILDKNIEFNSSTGSLSDIAPTILKIMNQNIPKEMTGKVLIK